HALRTTRHPSSLRSCLPPLVHPVSGIIEQVTAEPQELRVPISRDLGSCGRPCSATQSLAMSLPAVATKRSAAPAVAEAIVRSSVAALVISLATRPPFRTR